MKQQPRLGAARRKQNKQKKNKKKRKENDSTDEWSDGGWIDVSGVETCVEGRRVRSAAARWRYRRKLAEKKAKKKIKKKREIKNPMKDPVRGLGGEGGSNRSPAETESKFVAIDFDSRCTARRLRQSFAGITNQLGSTQSAQVDLGEKNNSAANQKQRRFVFQDLDVRCYHGTLFLLARVPSQVPRARRGLLNFIRTDVESTFLPR